MLLAVTLSSIPMSYVGWIRYAVQRELEYCEKSGIEIYHSDFTGPNFLNPIIGWYPPYHRVGGVGLKANTKLPKNKQLGKELPYLSTIDMDGYLFNKDSWKQLKSCNKVDYLALTLDEIPSKFKEDLALTLHQLEQLSSIGCSGGKLDSSFLRTLQQLPSLEGFSAWCCDVCEEELIKLIQQENMAVVTIQGCNLEATWGDVKPLCHPDLIVQYWD